MVELALVAPDEPNGSAELDAVFHSLADPSRRKILALLREAEALKVGDIAAAFHMSLNGVSKHLKVLEAAGVVSRRVIGREHWMHVDGSALQSAYEWLHFHHHFWSERLQALADHLGQSGTKLTDEHNRGSS